MERLRTGELQIICTVDVFNEGLDVPEVDTVLMLRPTESPVVFLQQLGHGLRRNLGQDRQAIRLKVIQARGRPILMLDCDHNPQLPGGETLFVADGVSYSGNFAKIALNVAHRAGHPGNVLPDLLWSWFGTNAGQPGTVQYVELVPDKPHWQMRPASPAATRDESANRQK